MLVAGVGALVSRLVRARSQRSFLQSFLYLNLYRMAFLVCNKSRGYLVKYEPWQPFFDGTRVRCATQLLSRDVPWVG